MIDLAYVERSNGDWLNENMYSLAKGLRLLGVEVRGFDFSEFDCLDITRNTLVGGSVNTVRLALKRLGVPSPNECNGMPPQALLQFYGRKLWMSTIGDIRSCAKGDVVFIKPLREHKAFDGHLVSGHFRDLIQTASFDDDFEILCSEPVNFVSEYRGFVNNCQLIGLRHYKGDFMRVVDYDIVHQSATAWHGPMSYSIDFGLTNDNRTLVVEINDGFALGSYGLPSIQYARFVVDRWEQMARA